MPDFILNFLQPIFAFLFGISAFVATIVGVAYWLFKLFSDKWLSAKFNERLADYKHAQQKELENLRFEIDKLRDRTIKFHQREFDLLPETWALLVEAHGTTAAVISQHQSYAIVSSMNETQLDEFLTDSIFENWQKEELKASSDKDKYYQKAIALNNLMKAKNTYHNFCLYQLKHGIFLLPDIHKKIKKMSSLIFEANMEHELQLKHNLGIGDRKSRKKFEDEGKGFMEELEADIRKRLWS